MDLQLNFSSEWQVKILKLEVWRYPKAQPYLYVQFLFITKAKSSKIPLSSSLKDGWKVKASPQIRSFLLVQEKEVVLGSIWQRLKPEFFSKRLSKSISSRQKIQSRWDFNGFTKQFIAILKWNWSHNQIENDPDANLIIKI
jgi:hypothetical protein